MKTKTWLPIAVALVLGLCAAMLAKNAMSRKATVATPVKIVVAKRAVAPGAALTADDLDLHAVAGEALPEGAHTDAAVLVGRTVHAQVVKGQPILESLLAPVGSAAGLQALVPAGMRAMTIEVNEFSAVAGLIAPGARVDVLSTMQDAAGGGSMSRTIVQNVLVKAVGQATGQTPEQNIDAKPARSVTLLVTSKQAEALQLSTVAGRPWLVLRGVGDNDVASSAGTTLAELRGVGSPGISRDFLATLWRQRSVVEPKAAGDPKAALTAAKKPEPRSVHTIRGTVETTVAVAPQAPQTESDSETETERTYANTEMDPD